MAGFTPRDSQRDWVGHPGGTVPGLAALRLDTADRHHALAGHIDHVAAEGERLQGGVGQTALARPDEHHAILQVGLGERPVDPGEADLEREGHVVAEGSRSRSAASFPAVDGDEVDPPGAVASMAATRSSQNLPSPTRT